MGERKKWQVYLLFHKLKINPASLTDGSDGVAAPLSTTSQHSMKRPRARSGRMCLWRAHIDSETICLFSSGSGGWQSSAVRVFFCRGRRGSLSQEEKLFTHRLHEQLKYCFISAKWAARSPSSPCCCLQIQDEMLCKCYCCSCCSTPRSPVKASL